MKLEGYKIVIESRSEIETIQSMIAGYLKHGKAIANSDRKELKNLEVQLDGLWYSW